MKLVHLHAERTANSSNILRDVFSKADCRSCGECCKRTVDNFHVPVLLEDPNYHRILKATKSRFPDKVDSSPCGFNISLQNDHCGFLEGRDGSYTCSIYSIRPLICDEIPFLPEDLYLHCATDNSTFQERLMVLTSSCPQIKEAKDLGVTYVSADDLVNALGEKGGQEYRFHIDILSSAFLKMMARVTDERMPEALCFAVIEDNLAFLVR
jgi:Fe-S-cluster containining protein